PKLPVVQPGPGPTFTKSKKKRQFLTPPPLPPTTIKGEPGSDAAVVPPKEDLPLHSAEEIGEPGSDGMVVPPSEDEPEQETGLTTGIITCSDEEQAEMQARDCKEEARDCKEEARDCKEEAREWNPRKECECIEWYEDIFGNVWGCTKRDCRQRPSPLNKDKYEACLKEVFDYTEMCNPTLGQSAGGTTGTGGGTGTGGTGGGGTGTTPSTGTPGTGGTPGSTPKDCSEETLQAWKKKRCNSDCVKVVKNSFDDLFGLPGEPKVDRGCYSTCLQNRKAYLQRCDIDEQRGALGPAQGTAPTVTTTTCPDTAAAAANCFDISSSTWQPNSQLIVENGVTWPTGSTITNSSLVQTVADALEEAQEHIRPDQGYVFPEITVKSRTSQSGKYNPSKNTLEICDSQQTSQQELLDTLTHEIVHSLFSSIRGKYQAADAGLNCSLSGINEAIAWYAGEMAGGGTDASIIGNVKHGWAQDSSRNPATFCSVFESYPGGNSEDRLTAIGLFLSRKAASKGTSVESLMQVLSECPKPVSRQCADKAFRDVLGGSLDDLNREFRMWVELYGTP
ncbi:hypothetical protein ACFL2Q_15635, partial [Thermodesulfobacteriota bacterium]